MKYQNPPWDRDVSAPHFPEFTASMNADVVIVGGGLVGITTAYLLSKQNIKVVLVEKDSLGFGATGVTTAFITQSLDTDTQELIEMFGENQAKQIVNSHKDAIETIESIVNTEGIDCEFMKCSNYIYGLKDDDKKILKEEYEALIKLGVACDFSTANDLGFNHSGYVEVKNQAKFHPLKYLYSVAKIANNNGVEIYEKTEVEDIEKNDNMYVVKTNHGDIKAKWVVAATYSPLGEPWGLYIKKGMYNSYVLELIIPKNIIKEGTYEDTYNPYNYFRVDKRDNYDRMILGGEDVKAIFPSPEEKSYGQLEEYFKERFGNIKYEIVYKWSGPILEPSDGIASIGPESNNEEDRILYAFGFSGNGMTYSHIAAKILTDIILQKNNPYYEVYKTSRWMNPKNLAFKAKDYTEETIFGVVKNLFKRKKKN